MLSEGVSKAEFKLEIFNARRWRSCSPADFRSVLILYFIGLSAYLAYYAPVEKDAMKDKYTEEHLTLTSNFDLDR